MRRHLLRHTLILALLGATPALAERLPDVVDAVLAAHPDVASARALLEASESLRRQSRSAFFPTVGLSWQRAETDAEQLGQPLDRSSRRSEASLSWNLFSGGSDVYRLSSARHGVAAADADLAAAREELALRVADVYADILRLRHINAAGKALLQATRQLQSKVTARVEAGRISPADRDQVEISVAQAQQQVAELRAALGAAEFLFEQLTGHAADVLTPPDFDALDFSQSALRSQAETGNPNQRAAQRRAQARQAEIGVARGALMPSVDIALRKRLNARIEPVEVSDTVRSAQLAVTLDVPLGGASWYRVDEAVARHHAAQADVETIREAVAIDLARQATDLTEREAVKEALQTRLVASRNLIDAYTLQFDAGRRSLSDLLDAHQGRFNAVVADANNRFERFRLKAGLLALAGGLQSALRDNYQDQHGAMTPAMTDALSGLAADDVPPQLAALRARLDGWLAAWQGKDYDAYRSFYAAGYNSPDHPTTGAWEAERRARLDRPGASRIDIAALDILPTASDHWVARFRQHYRARGYEDVVTKQLEWAFQSGQWHIVRESTTP